MNKIMSFGLLALVSSMILGGVTSSAFAQTDPTILITLANRAQTQIERQISDSSSEEIKQLFRNGIAKVKALEESLEQDDIETAKKHFLNAMRIFAQISHLINEQETKEEATQLRAAPQPDYSSDLERIHKYVTSLKALAKKYNAPIDFSEIDSLIDTAQEQARNGNSEIVQTINEIKHMVIEINNDIRDFAAKQQQERAKRYAQQYLEQLDRLIENAKSQGVSEEVIVKLENLKEKLSEATDPHDIVEQIKEIISIKKQFELTKNDRIESRVMQIEKTINRLSQIEAVDSEQIESAKEQLALSKGYLREGEFDKANEILRELNEQLRAIASSL